jgi:hypothetical protein
VLDADALADDAARLAALLSPRQRAAASRLARLARAPRRSVRLAGGDVMGWTGLPPGPRVGELLAALAVEVAAGRVRDRKSARHWILRAVDVATLDSARRKRRDTG